LKLVVTNNTNIIKLVVQPDNKLKFVIKPQDIIVLKINNCNSAGSPASGGSIILNVIAGEGINGDSLVMVKDNLAYKNDISDEGNAYFCVGFAINSALIGQNVAITQIGEQISAGWGLLPNSVYYAGVNGGITTTPPITGISQVVGIPKDSDTMIVEINEPVLM